MWPSGGVALTYNLKDGVPELDLYGRGADKEMNERYILLESDKRLLFEDRVYEEVVLNEQVLALVTLLLGRGHNLDRVYSLYRHANTPPLPLHTDCFEQSPFHSYPTLAAVTWCLTDFNGLYDGSTCFVPGTHKFNRRPTKYESHVNMAHARSVHAPAGSVLVHNGATWHGAPTRQAEGIRVSLNIFYKKGNLPASDGYRGREPEGMLERNPLGFAYLFGHPVHNGEILTRGEVLDDRQGDDYGDERRSERRAARSARGGL